MTAEQGQGRPWSLTRWVDDLPGHDLTLTWADVDGAPTGAVFSIEAVFGPGGRVPISLERRRDGSWIVHSRAHVSPDALVGARATPRRRVSRLTGEEAPRNAEQIGDREHASFTEAAARINQAPR